jgi:hypothetical protein
MKFEIKVNVDEPFYFYSNTWNNYEWVVLNPGLYALVDTKEPCFLSLGDGIVLFIDKKGYWPISETLMLSVFIKVKATINVSYTDSEGRTYDKYIN